MLRSYRFDAAQYLYPAPAVVGWRLVVKTLVQPGLMFTFLMRLQLAAESKRSFGLSRIIHVVNVYITGGEFGHGCAIGEGLVVKHPVGVVVGSGTVLGANCIVLGKVTFGERYVDQGHRRARRYPTVGSRCLIGTGAILLGGISLGDDVKVGAGAVVLADVPAGWSVAGNPARRIGSRDVES